MKIRARLLTLAFLLALAPNLFAKNISKEAARTVAKNFITERIICHQSNWNANSLIMSDVTTYDADGQAAVYVFSNNGQGFVLVAADDALTPVLGYSCESDFAGKGINPNFEYVVSDFVEQVKYVKAHAMSAQPNIEKSWNTYLSGNLDYSVLSDTTTVGPLITTLWDQMSPYNEFCPVDAGAHVPTGCVATAMSQIMNYYKYPITGSGQHSYTAGSYGTQSADFGATTYGWDLMQNTESSMSGAGIPAIATLMYHAGVSVNMNYAPAGSGAYTQDVPNAMKTYFKYNAAIAYISRSNYASTWETILTDQLNASKPILYSGSSPTLGGHAFVCDGYQTVSGSNMFHFNFGWSGTDNGYYVSSNPDGFTNSQGCVRNIYPNSGYPYGCSATTLTGSNGSIEDGSGPTSVYGNNLSCTWLIDPTDSVKKITVNFVRFDVAANDTLYFYDGADDNAPLIAKYSGKIHPPNVSSTGDKLFLKFVTDGVIQDTGWLVEYNSTLPALCSGTKTMTAPIGSFTDGSGAYNYNNNSLCRFKIQPPFAKDVTLTFDEFDLYEGDELTVYDLAASSVPLVVLTGNTIPDPITVASGGIYMVFKSNSYYTASGFSASYYAGNVANKTLTSINSLNIGPNPANDVVMVGGNSVKSQKLEMTLCDITGKTLYSESFSAPVGNFRHPVYVSQFRPGMYFFTVRTAEGSVTEKVIIK